MERWARLESEGILSLDRVVVVPAGAQDYSFRREINWFLELLHRDHSCASAVRDDGQPTIFPDAWPFARHLVKILLTLAQNLV